MEGAIIADTGVTPHPTNEPAADCSGVAYRGVHRYFFGDFSPRWFFSARRKAAPTGSSTE